jgi:hypothetical protein
MTTRRPIGILPADTVIEHGPNGTIEIPEPVESATNGASFVGERAGRTDVT